MGRPAVGDHGAGALDRVLVAEACASHVDAAGVHEEAVVELRRCEIANVRLEHDRLEAEVAQTLVAARIALEVVDACDLEPHEVVRVVGDALRVRLCEADAHLCCRN